MKYRTSRAWGLPRSAETALLPDLPNPSLWAGGQQSVQPALWVILTLAKVCEALFCAAYGKHSGARSPAPGSTHSFIH